VAEVELRAVDSAEMQYEVMFLGRGRYDHLRILE